MMKVLFLSVFLLPFFLYSTENSLTAFNYDPQYKKYSFKNWEKIGVRLTKNILHGKNKREVADKLAVARNLLARVAKMGLNKEQADVVRAYLINFLKEYLEDEEFLRIIKTEELLSEINEPGRLHMQTYSPYWNLPRYIIATVANLSPTQAETDECVEIVKKVPNDFLSKRYSYDLINLIVALSSNRTADKYLDKFDSIKISSEIRYSKDRNEAWKILLEDFEKRLKTNKLGGFIYESRIRYTEKYKDFCEGLPFELYSATDSVPGKYYLAIEMTSLLETAVESKTIKHTKLIEEYRKLKVINDDLLSNKYPESELKDYLRDETYEFTEKIEERYNGLRTLYGLDGKIKPPDDEEMKSLIDKMLAPKKLSPDSPDPDYEHLKKNYYLHLPDYIKRKREIYMTPALPLQLQYLLGEIASTDAFSILLENYMLKPDARAAISLAACTGRDNITFLFRELSKKGLLDEFLKSVAPGDWEKLKVLSPSEKEQYYYRNYSDIRKSARKKAIPILG